MVDSFEQKKREDLELDLLRKCNRKAPESKPTKRNEHVIESKKNIFPPMQETETHQNRPKPTPPVTKVSQNHENPNVSKKIVTAESKRENTQNKIFGQASEYDEKMRFRTTNQRYKPPAEKKDVSSPYE